MMINYFNLYSSQTMKKTIAKLLIGASAIALGVGATFAAGTLGGAQKGAAGIPIAGAENLTWAESLIDSIKSFITYVTGFLGSIALVILLYGGFQMVTAAGDEKKYGAGFQILKQAAIGLVFIGLAALMVQLIFWIIGVVGG